MANGDGDFLHGLQVFHQGYGNNGQLWLSTFGGETWSPDVQVSNVGMSASPGAIAYGKMLYVFHQGYGNNGQLWYDVFDGETWAGDVEIPKTGMSEGPSAVV